MDRIFELENKFLLVIPLRISPERVRREGGKKLSSRSEFGLVDEDIRVWILCFSASRYLLFIAFYRRVFSWGGRLIEGMSK